LPKIFITGVERPERVCKVKGQRSRSLVLYWNFVSVMSL